MNTKTKERKESTQKDKTVETLNRRTKRKRRGEKCRCAVACFPHIRTTSIDDDDKEEEEEEEEEEEGAFREGGGIDGDVGDDDDEDGVLFGFYLFCASSAMIYFNRAKRESAVRRRL